MSLNKVILIGNVGRDPEVRYFDSGNAIANFPMATSERGYKLANGTEVPERTEWHNIVVRRDLVSFVERWVKKGSGVYVEGKLRYRNYDDQQGIKRYVTEIYADKVEFFNFGRPPESSGTAQQAQPAQPKQTSGVTYTTHTQNFQVSEPDTPYSSSEESPDDLPF
ncbi:single-stranded DNA-binding protein [Bacteroidia bacterium]|nr:single-stranded DNA-binding protein [Bacteroidia bacterium]